MCCAQSCNVVLMWYCAAEQAPMGMHVDGARCTAVAAAFPTHYAFSNTHNYDNCCCCCRHGMVRIIIMWGVGGSGTSSHHIFGDWTSIAADTRPVSCQCMWYCVIHVMNNPTSAHPAFPPLLLLFLATRPTRPTRPTRCLRHLQLCSQLDDVLVGL